MYPASESNALNKHTNMRESTFFAGVGQPRLKWGEEDSDNTLIKTAPRLVETKTANTGTERQDNAYYTIHAEAKNSATPTGEYAI